MGKRSFRYRVCDLQELVSEELELTVEIGSGDTVRVGDGRLMLVFAVVPVEDEPECAGVLMVEPVSGRER